MRVDLGGFAAFDQPDDERTKDVTEEVKEKPEQRTGMAENNPGPDIGDATGLAGGVVSIGLFFHAFDVCAKGAELFVEMFVTAIDVINASDLRRALGFQACQHKRG
jgi:hypothetical protein